MELLLHIPKKENGLRRHYIRAIADADELYIVSAYLTEWKPGIELPDTVRRLRVVIGTDFGVTRKIACKDLLKWMPADRLNDFRAAEKIQGFHPKAVFWKTTKGKCFAIVGSSNLTYAAFEHNVEANVVVSLSHAQFNDARNWINWMCQDSRSVPVSEDWIKQYSEAPQAPANHKRKPRGKSRTTIKPLTPVIQFELPVLPANRARELVKMRRAQLRAFDKAKRAIIHLFGQVATGHMSNASFYSKLNELWSFDAGNRLQGPGWERKGASANFSELATAFLAVKNANPRDRDEIVRTVLNMLKNKANPARKAWFSEMLTLFWPDDYPLLNKPVREFLATNHFRPPRRATEGVQYVDLAEKLRAALANAPAGYPAKNIAELDLLIWDQASVARDNH